MYQDFFGFRELPFELTPDPRFLFLTHRHREALVNLRHGLSTAKGLVLLIGDAGTGKTTLIKAALESLQADVGAVYLNNPALTRAEFIECLARGFTLSSEAAQSKATLIRDLQSTLEERREQGKITALVIDEAQSMSNELLEEVRLLANIETNTRKLLPVVIAGQPELAVRLNDVSLRQLKQRVALRCDLSALTLQETASYIAARIRVAGGEAARVFTREAVTTIHERSGGIPRTISVICDNALVSGFALDRRPVGRDVVLEVCADFDLKPVAPEPVPPVPSDDANRAARRVEVATPTDQAHGTDGTDHTVAAGEPRRRFSFF
jgi:general secretion pathway protein A